MASPSTSAGWAGDADRNPTDLLQTLKLTTIDLVGGILCHICHITFGNKKDFDNHYVKHNTGSTDIVYTCVVCHKNIVGYRSFHGHCYLVHVTKDKFKCEICPKFFSKLCILKQHMDTKHNFVCSSCKKQFSSAKELQLHQIVHKNDESPPYDCHSCGQQVDNIDSCEQHIEQHCELFYSCPICNENIPNLSNASDHLIKHFGKVLNREYETGVEYSESPIIPKDSSIDIVGGILCCYCKSIFKNRVEFDMHFSMEHCGKDIVYSCNICGKQYEKYFLFGSHCYDHFAKDRFECEECGKTFSRLSLLVIHTEAFHSSDTVAAKPFTCTQCDHGFMTESRLREHLREAHSIQRIQCPAEGCQEIFETPKDLILHKRQHKIVDSHRCKQCSLHFTTMTACEKHIPVHCKKQYSCPVCNKSYSEKYLIMKHVPQHFSAIIHICKDCGKMYNAKNRLVEHTKVHTKDRVHKCSYCDKSFIKSYQLQQHLNKHTGLKPYKCVKCPKSFASAPNWSKHLRKIHNIQPKSLVKPVLENNNEVFEAAVPKVKKTNEKCKIIESYKTDGLVDSMGSEMSVDAFSCKLYESDESTIESDGIDPALMEKESKIYDDSTTTLDVMSDITELTNLTSDNIDALITAYSVPDPPTSVWFPREYGPDFVWDGAGGGGAAGGGAVIDLDGALLPHIDPRLTQLGPCDPHDPFDPRGPPGPRAPGEPPVLTKLPPDHQLGYADITEAAHFSFMNTNLY
ncbi:zinc finger protein 271-like [Achroia grisella]|uniref:zinc finger protein 271-like n=1 Tax=Achroia grisella TaxID=688607 RepID=UPI0027D2A8AC|nr:zinc finger protein 271-like [Achroia grisella]